MNFNDKLHRGIKSLNHVHLIEMTTDRKYFTTHGFHLNNLGKETIAKEIACQIREIVNSRPNKEEHISTNTTVDRALSFNCTSNKGNASETVTKSPQELCPQQMLSKSGNMLRTSKRLNKAGMCAVVEPVTDNSVSDKIEDGKGESRTVSALDFRTVNVKETDVESVEVEENKDGVHVL